MSEPDPNHDSATFERREEIRKREERAEAEQRGWLGSETDEDFTVGPIHRAPLRCEAHEGDEGNAEACLSVKRQASAIRRERGRCNSNHEGIEETNMLVVAPHVTHKRTEEGMGWMLDLREAHAPLHHACKSEQASDDC